MRRLKNRNVLVNSFVILLLFCCWGCQEEPLDSGDRLRPGQLTVEEARGLFEKYASAMTSRSMVTDEMKTNLDPGIITAEWEDAALSTTRVNSFVSVPIGTANDYQVKSPFNEDWVDVVQKLVVVQEDATRRRSIYLMNIIPEGDFAVMHKNDISGLCEAEQMPEDFSGLVVYTKTWGGLPVYVESYWEGVLTENVFLFDEKYSFEENLERINTMLYGYSLRSGIVILSRSSESGGGGDYPGDSWSYHTEGNSFIYDGWTCWNSSDSNGNHFVVADTNGDGKPDTIINTEGGDAVGDGGKPKPTPPDPEFPDLGGDTPNPGTNPGDVNPGGGVRPGGGGSSGTKPGTETPKGPNIDTTGMSKKLQEQINSVIKALKKIGLSDKVLNNLSVRMGSTPFGTSAVTTMKGSVPDVLFGNKPIMMTFERNPAMSPDMYKLVVGHEFYHLYVYGISRDAGSMSNLYSKDQGLQSLLNNFTKDGKTDINGAHHEYIGNDNAKYEGFLRDAFPGEKEEFYKYGKWGGGISDSEAFKKLPVQEQDEIKKYIKDNKLE